MKVSYSELCVIGGRIEENVDRLLEAGAEEIELMLDGEGWDRFETKQDHIAASLRTKRVDYSIHVPVWDLNLTAENATMRASVIAAYKKSIEFAALLGAKHVVLHTGWCSDRHFSKKKARERSREAIEELVRFDEEFGQLLLVENICGPTTNLFTQEQFSAFLDGLPSRAGYLVDVGHAHLNGWDLGSLFKTLGRRLHALHLHDNDGRADAHLPLGRGTIDWEGTLDLIAESGSDPTLILEYNIGTAPEILTEGKALIDRWMAGRGYLAGK